MLTASVYAYENKRNKVIPVCNNKGKRFGLPTRKKLLYTVANPARGLLNREKKENEKEKVCCFSHSAHWLPTRKISQSRSWSAE